VIKVSGSQSKSRACGGARPSGNIASSLEGSLPFKCARILSIAAESSMQAADVDSFMAVFQEPIEKGDVFDLVYLPGKGLDIYKNGGFKSTIDGGMPFKEAIVGIWLGDKPADKNLKKGMLGN
jgi:hypothetical protein